MDAFAQRAAQILDAAQTAAEYGQPASDLAFLISEDGGLRIVADSDWPLDSLALHHGAKAAYRMSEHRGVVRVEGRQGTRKCLLESESGAATARKLLQRW